MEPGAHPRRARRAATRIALFVAGAAAAGAVGASNPAALLAATTGLLTDTAATQQCTGTETATDTTACPPAQTNTVTTPTVTETTPTVTETTPTVTETTPTVTETTPAETTSTAPSPAPIGALPPSSPATAPRTTASPAGSKWHGGSARWKAVRTTSARMTHVRRHRARPQVRHAAKKHAAAAKSHAAAATAAPHVAIPFGLTVRLPAPPSYLVRTYQQAGRRYDVPWKILAAINGIETGYGRNLNVSSAGAIGWMQFLPSTWSVYGEGGNPYAPHDAIFAAARLLHAAGASTDLPAAIYSYNHADWYVAAVMWQASNMDSRGRTTSSAHGYALPLDAQYMAPLGRTDDGVDIENAPDGAPVYSMTPGIVVAVAGDPGGFGPSYPVILVTDGPLAGRYVYYGHVGASLVKQGQTVEAGQPIAVMGHTGDAAGLGHGHIEIGFSDGSGTPLEQHGAEAWTASGQAMRGVLQTLARDAGVKTQ